MGLRLSVVAAVTVLLAGCGSSGPAGSPGSAVSPGPAKPSAPFSSPGDAQCLLSYRVDGSTVDITAVTTVSGQLSYEAGGTMSAADDARSLDAGTHQLQRTVHGFQRLGGTLTAADHTVYHCRVQPEP